MTYDDAYDFNAVFRMDNSFDTLDDIAVIKREDGTISQITHKEVRFTVDNLLSESHLIVNVLVQTKNEHPGKDEAVNKRYSEIEWLPHDTNIGVLVATVRKNLEKIKEQIINDEHPVSFF